MLSILFLLAVFPRSTTDTDADFLAALRQARLLETAEVYCDQRMRGVGPGTRDAARWSVALSAVRAERARIEPSDEAWQAAAVPCESFLSSYADAPWSPWVRFQLGLVAHGRSERMVMELRAAPGNAALRDETLEQLRTTLSRYDAVIAETQQRLESRPPATAERSAEDVPADDLRRLLVDGELQKVRALLLRVACYAPGSSDALAAATEAHDSIQRLARSLARTDPGWRQMRVLEAETLIALTRANDALATLQQLSESGPWNADEVAVGVRAALAVGDVAGARSRLAAAEPTLADATGLLELARLQLLLAEGDTAAALDLVAEIDRRYGGYWKRLAELAILEAGGASSSEAPALIAADATTLLQAGQSQAAQRRFFQAAEAALQGRAAADAVRFALLATAAAKQHGSGGEAARRLAAVAVSAAEAEMAPRAHLLAIQLRAAADNGAADFQSLLWQHLEHWPHSAEAEQVRGWLDDVLAATGRHEQRLQMWLDAVGENPEDVDVGVRVRDAAVDAVVRSEVGGAGWKSVHGRVKQLASSIGGSAPAAPLLTAAAARLEGLFGDRVAGPPAQMLEDVDPFAFYLLQVRYSGEGVPQLADAADSIEEATIAAAVQRLLDDARSTGGQRRQQLAQAAVAVAEGLEEGAPRQSLVARALVLGGRVPEAQQRVAAADPPDRVPLMMAVAEALVERGDGTSLEIALGYWNSVAAKTTKGSETWGRAKLGAARALVQLQRTDEAVALLRYALLVAPPSAQSQAEEMERLVERYSGHERTGSAP